MKQKLVNYYKAGYPGLYIITHEEQRVEAVLHKAAEAAGFGLSVWTFTRGIIDVATGQLKGAADPLDMLKAFTEMPERTVLIAKDFHMFLADPNPMLFRAVKDALLIAKTKSLVLAVMGCQLKLPPELEKEIQVVEFQLPDRAQLLEVLQGVAASAETTLPEDVEPLIDACTGLTTIEAENAASLSWVETPKKFCPSVINREKSLTIKKNGILEIVESKLTLDDIGGLEVLKAWLAKRRSAFGQAAKDYGLPTPKGVLMVGIPGCGKSLSAKAMAAILGCPLLKLDAGKIFGSLVGESERNVRSAIQTAEAIAPCVLWIDELEKGFSGTKSSGSTDGGTSSRVFGTFLSWLQDKTASVFVVATANDVSALPPELLRKGRFDEQFFIDLPDPAERKEIWKIQIEHKGRKPKKFDLEKLSGATEGFTGSEIEALFSESLFAAFESGAEPDTELLLALSKEVVPLSKMMAAEIDAIRNWAQGRARRASTVKAAAPAGRKLA